MKDYVKKPLDPSPDHAPQSAVPAKAKPPGERDGLLHQAVAHQTEQEAKAHSDKQGRERFSHQANACQLADLLSQLQQSHGNSYVQRVISEMNESKSNAHPKSSGGQGLDAGTKAEMEAAFGEDFSDVRVYTDSTAEQVTKELGARALTHGSDIYFDAGEYNPSDSEGKHLLAHELTHIIQQRGSATNRQTYEAGQAGDTFEQEAEQVATSVRSGGRARVTKHGAAPSFQRQPRTGTAAAQPITAPAIVVHPQEITPTPASGTISAGRFNVPYLYHYVPTSDFLPLVMQVPQGVSVQVNSLTGALGGTYSINSNLDGRSARPVTINYQRTGQRIPGRVQVIFTQENFSYIVVFQFPMMGSTPNQPSRRTP